MVEVMKNSVLLYCRSNVKSQSATTTTLPIEAVNTELDTNKRVLVSWTLPDDKQVSMDQKDKYEILETGDLIIKDLNWADMGNYVCTVSDDQGSDSVSSFVYPASVRKESFG